MGLGMQAKKVLNRFGYDIKYHRSFYDTVVAPLGINTILDIGANDGTYAKEMYHRFPEATIHSFEPLAGCFSRLTEVSKTHPRILPHQYALGDADEEKDISRSSFDPSSSILSMSTLHKKLYPKSSESTKERIVVKRLDAIAHTLLLKEPLFVKIDVQGYEDKVIDGAKETLARASIIVVETSFFPLYEQQPLFIDIARKLSEIGFSYYGAYHTHHSKKTQRPIYEDSVFISHNTRSTFENAELA